MSPLLPAVAYSPDVERPEPDEQATIAELVKVFTDMAGVVADHEGHAHRAVHAKGHALLRGRFRVLDGLAPELRHGLFAAPAEYNALVRLSSPPAEQLPDTVSTPRAMAVKLLDVPGPRVEGGDELHSQDFLMVNGPAFNTPGISGFLRSAKLLAATTERMPRTKQVLSATLRGTEAALEAVGGQSATLKALGGEPQHHPLGETFFTQVPFRYGPYMAKFSWVPVSPALKALTGEKLDAAPDTQREAVAAFFAQPGAVAEWELRVQLCRDLEKMPIEDASVVWPEEISPYLPVGRLVVGAQSSWSADAEATEDSLAFAPWHALAAHQPLGNLNRARRVVMAASRQFRSTFNRCPIHEPR
ncbi:catalase family protein [Stenotrophomonas sp. PD6]|uniref:catalase family protein n=1 Tax=Stenotrophomonas sp. PD6 TaxID=3368612 RepID=UPI003B9E298D